MTPRHRVVIIGGGLAAAKALRRVPVDVTVIDGQAHHLFRLPLYQVATGVLSQGDIAPPLRDILRHQQEAEVALAEVPLRETTGPAGPHAPQDGRRLDTHA